MTKLCALAPLLASLLNDLRAAASFTESDSLAVIRRRSEIGEAVDWLPVFLPEADNKPYVRIDGEWREVESVQGFERFEKVRRRKLFNTATLRVVEE